MSERESQGKHPVEQIAEACGGKIVEGGILPDGSGFAIMSMPLPKDHWLTQEGYNIPPMPFRMGTGDHAVICLFPSKGWPDRGVHLTKQEFADRIRAAGRYAIRASTMNGKEMDFDPDAMLQNLVNGMFGYWTIDGLSGEAFDNPPERTKWCCDGDGQGEHHKRCRYSRTDVGTMQAPANPANG